MARKKAKEKTTEDIVQKDEEMERTPTDFSEVLASIKRDKEAKFEREFKWRGIKVHARSYLDYQDFMELANLVSAGCFISGKYRPEALELLLRIVVVEGYTDIVLPETNEERWDILFHTDLVPTIHEHISCTDYMQFEDLVKEMIRSTNEFLNSSGFALTRFINQAQGELEDTIKELAGDGLLNSFITSEGTD